MVYDPRRDQPRSRPRANGSSVVDTLLDPVTGPQQTGPSDPPAATSPATAPEPPEPRTVRLLHSVGISTVLGTAVGLVVLVVLGLLRQAWKRRSR